MNYKPCLVGPKLMLLAKSLTNSYHVEAAKYARIIAAPMGDDGHGATQRDHCCLSNLKL